MLYVDLNGKIRPLRQLDTNQYTSWAIPSRNGKYVAIPAPTVESNVWVADRSPAGPGPAMPSTQNVTQLQCHQ